eukprot:Opistho-1_new@8929
MPNPCGSGSTGSPYTARVHPLDSDESGRRQMSFAPGVEGPVLFTHRVEDYELLEDIGCNSKGDLTVHRARHKPTGAFVAIKRIDLEAELDRFSTDEPHEIHLSRLLRDDNVTECLASFVVDDELWVVMPLLDGGCLASVLLTRDYFDGLPESVVSLCVRDILRALAYLHKNAVVFRNVRPSRMLAHSDGSVRLSNFADAVLLYRGGQRVRREYSFGASVADSLPWIAPEVLQQDLQGYDTSADIYGLGISAIQLATGRVPYAGMEPTKVLLLKLNGRPPALDDFSSSQRKFTRQFRQFVDLCLRRNARERPSAEQLLDHPFVKGTKRKSQILPSLLKALPSLSDRTRLEREAALQAQHALGTMRSQVAEAAAAELGEEGPPVLRRSIDDIAAQGQAMAEAAEAADHGAAGPPMWVF